ncbi:hypothetical protein HMPREF1865_01923 [Veillonella parvula]|nr:hypothetical protein HMPREF1865_01923 [Veillonella parvula]
MPGNKNKTTLIYYSYKDKRFKTKQTFLNIIITKNKISENSYKIIIRTTRKTDGLLTGYKPVLLGQRLKALAFTTFKPHSH